eukprot:gnl/MRDRNA2_/MRDRNA2_82019_c0_seq1.p1 gnl/MRDRNA2_/MRDRNA2_82019_c0~~gnl/MRDRNA2_/MRDRNA2_82019_c0_seq1.p1  ORF type:complete len:3203 (-),score=820.38 gnl/MRDRNA2_/MRDRNA2_82019_c0_seq1:2-8986(-)
MTGAAQRSCEQLTAGMHELRVSLQAIEAAQVDHQAKSLSANEAHSESTNELKQEVEVGVRRMGELRREFQELRSEITHRHQSDFSAQQQIVEQLSTDLASLSEMHKRSTDEMLGPIVQSLQHEVKQLTLKVEELTAGQEASTQKSEDLARTVDKLGVTVSEVDGKRQFLVGRLEKLQVDTAKMNNSDDLVERVWPKVRLQLQEADLLVPSPQRISALVYEKTAPLQSSLKRLEQELDQATKRSAELAEDLERLQLDERIASVEALGSAVESLKAKQAETATHILTIAADAEKARYMAAESLDRFPENYDWSQEEERLLQHDALLTQLEERVNMHQEWLDREQDALTEQASREARDAKSIAALELSKKNCDDALTQLAQRTSDIEGSLESISTIAKAIAQGSADKLEETLWKEIKLINEAQDGHLEKVHRLQAEISTVDQEHKEVAASLSTEVSGLQSALQTVREQFEARGAKDEKAAETQDKAIKALQGEMATNASSASSEVKMLKDRISAIEKQTVSNQEELRGEMTTNASSASSEMQVLKDRISSVESQAASNQEEVLNRVDGLVESVKLNQDLSQQVTIEEVQSIVSGETGELKEQVTKLAEVKKMFESVQAVESMTSQALSEGEALQNEIQTLASAMAALQQQMTTVPTAGGDLERRIAAVEAKARQLVTSSKEQFQEDQRTAVESILEKMSDLWNKLSIVEKDFAEKLEGQKTNGVSPELDALKTELMAQISELKVDKEDSVSNELQEKLDRVLETVTAVEQRQSVEVQELAGQVRLATGELQDGHALQEEVRQALKVLDEIRGSPLATDPSSGEEHASKLEEVMARVSQLCSTVEELQRDINIHSSNESCEPSATRAGQAMDSRPGHWATTVDQATVDKRIAGVESKMRQRMEAAVEAVQEEHSRYADAAKDDSAALWARIEILEGELKQAKGSDSEELSARLASIEEDVAGVKAEGKLLSCLYPATEATEDDRSVSWCNDAAATGDGQVETNLDGNAAPSEAPAPADMNRENKEDYGNKRPSSPEQESLEEVAKKLNTLESWWWGTVSALESQMKSLQTASSQGNHHVELHQAVGTLQTRISEVEGSMQHYQQGNHHVELHQAVGSLHTRMSAVEDSIQEPQAVANSSLDTDALASRINVLDAICSKSSEIASGLGTRVASLEATAGSAAVLEESVSVRMKTLEATAGGSSVRISRLEKKLDELTDGRSGRSSADAVDSEAASRFLSHVDTMHEKMNNQEAQLIEKVIGMINEKVAAIEEKVGTIDATQTSISVDRIAQVESLLKELKDDISSKVAVIADVEKRVDEADNSAQTRLGSLERSVGALHSRENSTELKVVALEETLAGLQKPEERSLSEEEALGNAGLQKSEEVIASLRDVIEENHSAALTRLASLEKGLGDVQGRDDMIQLKISTLEQASAGFEESLNSLKDLKNDVAQQIDSVLGATLEDMRKSSATSSNPGLGNDALDQKIAEALDLTNEQMKSRINEACAAVEQRVSETNTSTLARLGSVESSVGEVLAKSSSTESQLSIFQSSLDIMQESFAKADSGESQLSAFQDSISTLQESLTGLERVHNGNTQARLCALEASLGTIQGVEKSVREVMEDRIGTIEDSLVQAMDSTGQQIQSIQKEMVEAIDAAARRAVKEEMESSQEEGARSDSDAQVLCNVVVTEPPVANMDVIQTVACQMASVEASVSRDVTEIACKMREELAAFKPEMIKHADTSVREALQEFRDQQAAIASKAPVLSEADIMARMKSMLAELDASIPAKIQNSVGAITDRISAVEKGQEEEIRKLGSSMNDELTTLKTQVAEQQKTIESHSDGIGAAAPASDVMQSAIAKIQEDIAKIQKDAHHELSSSAAKDDSELEEVKKAFQEEVTKMQTAMSDEIKNLKTEAAFDSNLEKMKARLEDSLPKTVDDAIVKLQKNMCEEILLTVTKEALPAAIADFESRLDQKIQSALHVSRADVGDTASSAESATTLAADADAKIMCTLTVSDDVDIEADALQKLREELMANQTQALQTEIVKIAELESKVASVADASAKLAELESKVTSVVQVSAQVAEIESNMASVMQAAEAQKNVDNAQLGAGSEALNSRMAAIEQAVIKSLPGATEVQKLIDAFEDKVCALEASSNKSSGDIADMRQNFELVHEQKAKEQEKATGEFTKAIEGKILMMDEKMSKMLQEREGVIDTSAAQEGVKVQEELKGLLESLSQKAEVMDQRITAVEGNVTNMIHSGVCEALEQGTSKTSKDNARLTCTVTVSDDGELDPEVSAETLQKFREEVNFQIQALESKIDSRRLSTDKGQGSDEPIFSPQGLKAFEEIEVLKHQIIAVESKVQESCKAQDEMCVVSAAQELLERRVSVLEAKDVGSIEPFEKLEQRVSVLESSSAIPTSSIRVTGEATGVTIETTASEPLENRIVALENAATKASVQALPLRIESVEKRLLALEKSPVDPKSDANMSPSDVKSIREHQQVLESRVAAVEASGTGIESRVVAVEAWARLGAVNAEKAGGAQELQVLEKRIASVESSKADERTVQTLERRLASIDTSNMKNDGLSVMVNAPAFDPVTIESLEKRLALLEASTDKTNVAHSGTESAAIDAKELALLVRRVASLEAIGSNIRSNPVIGTEVHASDRIAHAAFERRLATVEAALEATTGSGTMVTGSAPDSPEISQSPLIGSYMSAITARVAALEVATGKSKDGRRLEAIEEWVRGAVAQQESTERKLQGTEKRLARAVHAMEEPVEELAMGALRMAQILGLTGDEMPQKREKTDWRDICFDLPRMLDHAWLRSRLPKKTTFLKLLKQKVDSSTIKELQDAHEDLAQQVVTLGRAERVSAPRERHPSPPEVPRAAGRIAGPAYRQDSPDVRAELHAEEIVVRAPSPRSHVHRIAGSTNEGDPASQPGAPIRRGIENPIRTVQFRTSPPSPGGPDAESMVVRPPTAPRVASQAPPARSRGVAQSGLPAGHRYAPYASAWGEESRES